MASMTNLISSFNFLAGVPPWVSWPSVGIIVLVFVALLLFFGSYGSLPISGVLPGGSLGLLYRRLPLARTIAADSALIADAAPPDKPKSTAQKIYGVIKVIGVIAGCFAAIAGCVIGVIQIGIFLAWWPEKLTAGVVPPAVAATPTTSSVPPAVVAMPTTSSACVPAELAKNMAWCMDFRHEVRNGAREQIYLGLRTDDSGLINDAYKICQSHNSKSLKVGEQCDNSEQLKAAQQKLHACPPCTSDEDLKTLQLPTRN